MNPKTTVGLVVALVVAVVGVWWAQSSTRQKAAERVVAEKSLFDPAIGEVVAFEVVQTSSGRPVKLVLEDEKWRMIEPAPGPGEQHVVSADLNNIKNLTVVKTYSPSDPDRPTDEMTLLKTPPKIIKLTDKSKSHVLKIGARQALSSNTYVQKEGDDTIYLVGSDVNADLKKDPSDYRGKQVAQFAQNEAMRLDVSGEHTYSLSNAAGSWTLETPIKGRVDKSKVSTLLSSLSSLSAQKYVDDAPKSLRPYGLEKPRLVVTVQTEKKTSKPPPEPPTSAPAEPQFDIKQQTVRVAFGGTADDKVFAKLEEPANPAVFQIPEATFKQIAQPLDELRDRGVADVGTGRAQRVSVSAGSDSVELTTNGGAWRITKGLHGGVQAAAEFAAVDDLLKSIRELKAVGFEEAESTSHGFNSPRATVEMALEGRLEPVRLVFGSKTPSGTGVYVRNEGEGFVAVVNADAIESLAARPVAYMNRDLIQFDKTQATQIELTFPEWNCLLVKQGDAWQFKRPVEGPTEATAVNNVLNDLSNLRGRRVVGRSDDAAKFGLDKPIVQAAVTVQAPAQPSPVATTQSSSQPAPLVTPPPVVHTVKATRHDGQAYAMVSGGETICEIDAKVMDDLVTELFDTRVATLEPSQARKLTVTGPTSFSFRKDGDEWRLVGEPTFATDPAKITEMFNALRDLRAGQYVRYAGANLADYGLDKPEVTIIAEVEGADPVTLVISSKGKDAGDRYAANASAPGRVFILKAADLPKFTKQLSDFRKPG